MFFRVRGSLKPLVSTITHEVQIKERERLIGMNVFLLLLCKKGGVNNRILNERLNGEIEEDKRILVRSSF